MDSSGYLEVGVIFGGYRFVGCLGLRGRSRGKMVFFIEMLIFFFVFLKVGLRG